MESRILIETLRQRWIEKGGYAPPLIGCTLNDLAALSHKQQVMFLPALYREFMLVFGRESGGLTHEGEFKFPNVMEFKQEWISILPSDDRFVFLTNHDAFALFFHTQDQDDDPIVYKIDESALAEEVGLSIEPYCLLSEFFSDWVRAEIEVNRKWEERRW